MDNIINGHPCEHEFRWSKVLREPISTDKAYVTYNGSRLMVSSAYRESDIFHCTKCLNEYSKIIGIWFLRPGY